MKSEAFLLGLSEGAGLRKCAALAIRPRLSLRPARAPRLRPKPGIKTVPYRDVTPKPVKSTPPELPAPPAPAPAPAPEATGSSMNPFFAAIPAGALGYMAGTGGRSSADPMAQMQQMMMMSQMMNQMGSPSGY